MAGKGWAMTDRSLQALAERVAGLHPPLVVECGSGRSTRVLRETVRPWNGWVLSLENVPSCFDETLRACGDLQGGLVLADIVDRPGGPFYDVTLPDSIGFALIDGPQQRRWGRHGTLPALWPHLAPGAVVWMDDTDREAEQQILRGWADVYDFTVHRVDGHVSELVKT